MLHILLAVGTLAAPPVPDVSSGTIVRIPAVDSQFVAPRDIDVWLPPGYDQGATHAVLYMHDGQMLFDAATTWNQQEWGVDEVATRLLDAGSVRPFIVVAIPNDGENRHAEYWPQRPVEALADADHDRLAELSGRAPGGRSATADYTRSDAYLRFLVEELKPLIDARFAVSPAAADTFVAGSSMGGLISLYAVTEYPDIFGGAACISTHWPGVQPDAANPYPAALLRYLERMLPEPNGHRLWFDHGTATLDAHYGEWQQEVDSLMRAAGYTPETWQTRVYQGAEHTEDAWRARLADPLEFLLGTR